MIWPQADPRLLLFLAFLAALAWLAIHYRKNLRRTFGSRKLALICLSVSAIVVFVAAALYLTPQSWLSDSTAASTSGRPSFIKSRSSIYPVRSADGKRVLASVLEVIVQNKGNSAKNLVRRILILEKTLNSETPPLLNESRNNANEFHKLQSLKIRTRLNLSRRLLSSFVVLHLKYEDALTNKSYNQEWFMKFSGVTRSGDFASSLYDATSDESLKIKSYMRKQNIQRLGAKE